MRAMGLRRSGELERLVGRINECRDKDSGDLGATEAKGPGLTCEVKIDTAARIRGDVRRVSCGWRGATDWVAIRKRLVLRTREKGGMTGAGKERELRPGGARQHCNDAPAIFSCRARAPTSQRVNTTPRYLSLSVSFLLTPCAN